MLVQLGSLKSLSLLIAWLVAVLGWRLVSLICLICLPFFHRWVEVSSVQRTRSNVASAWPDPLCFHVSWLKLAWCSWFAGRACIAWVTWFAWVARVACCTLPARFASDYSCSDCLLRFACSLRYWLRDFLARICLIIWVVTTLGWHRKLLSLPGWLAKLVRPVTWF